MAAHFDTHFDTVARILGDATKMQWMVGTDDGTDVRAHAFAALLNVVEQRVRARSDLVATVTSVEALLHMLRNAARGGPDAVAVAVLQAEARALRDTAETLERTAGSLVADHEGQGQ